MNEIYFKTIIDDTIIIREINETDFDDLYELLSNSNVCKYLGITEFNEIKQAKDFIDRVRKDYYNKLISYLGIELVNNHKLIGYIGLSKYDLTFDTCQVIYALNENYWHQGIMVKALKLFNKYLIEIENKKLIIATHIDENINSGKVMLKAGFLRDNQFDRTMIIKGLNRNLIGYTIRIKE
jgi:ribosomal-protein-alanine N-acetyltransferase